ncbi:MAG TPA: hypothetical protein VGP90_07315, partial [Acidimicrobiia bacterium]|nr:hypothetical protein [Acidimicrobiia bacterium]
MPPTSTDTRKRRQAAALAALLALPVGGAALARSHASASGPTLRSAALSASVDADRRARDRASRSGFRDEPAPAAE